MRHRSYLLLAHYPVVDRVGATITSAMTALDLHDLSRLARTYGLGGFFAQTNLPQQSALMQRLLRHWIGGAGGELNPSRKVALEGLSMVESIDEAAGKVEAEWGEKPLLIATSARDDGERMGFGEVGKLLAETTRPAIIIFGTASGLAPAALESCDVVVEPIGTPSDYNHLSVRSAASITVDRLFG